MFISLQNIINDEFQKSVQYLTYMIKIVVCNKYRIAFVKNMFCSIYVLIKVTVPIKIATKTVFHTTDKITFLKKPH